LHGLFCGVLQTATESEAESELYMTIPDDKVSDVSFVPEQTDRRTDRQTDLDARRAQKKKTQMHAHTHTHRQTDRDTHIHTHIQTHTDTYTHMHTHTGRIAQVVECWILDR
jgi:hypothetical protein